MKCSSNSLWVGVMCATLTSSVYGQLPQAVENASRNTVESVARASVKQVPLTAAEKEILPVAGLPMYQVNYNAVPAASTVEPIIRATEPVKLPLGNSYLELPPLVQNYMVHILKIENRFLENTSRYFPEYRAINENLARHLLSFKIKNLEAVNQNLGQFYSSVSYGVVTGNIDYASYFPREHLDYVFIGETHDTPLVGEEVLRVLCMLQEREPSRKIYFATEILSNTVEDRRDRLMTDLPLLHVVRSVEDPVFKVLNRRKNERAKYAWYLEKLLAQGVDLVGLEPSRMMVREFFKQSFPEGIKEESLWIDFWGSDHGMSLRNKKWKEILLQLREQDPDALIVVHGGNGHISWDELGSIGRSLPGKSFTLSFIGVGKQWVLPPIVMSMRVGPVIEEQFNNSENAKLLFTLKPVDETVGRTEEVRQLFKNTMGSDMLVLVHEVEEK